MKITAKIELPDAALRQHIAVLGKTGSGKTYTQRGMVQASDLLFPPGLH